MNNLDLCSTYLIDVFLVNFDSVVWSYWSFDKHLDGDRGENFEFFLLLLTAILSASKSAGPHVSIRISIVTELRVEIVASCWIEEPSC